MPLYDYRCARCRAVTEVFLRLGDQTSDVTCARCGSTEMARLVSRFSFKPSYRAKYSEDFREKTLPFLKSRPGAREMFAEGGESDEAKAFRLSEQIGERVDQVLEDRVFRDL